MELINNTQADILEQAARFKYLSTSQVQRLCGKSLGYIREQLSSLYQRGYIAAYNMEKPGRAEYIYFLTEKGKNLLLHHHKVFDEEIRLPVGQPMVVRDYNHRKNFIDLHIALYHYMKEQDIEIELFHAYFDKTGNNRTDANLESKTKIELGNNDFFMPDGIMITNNFGEKKLYLLEMYNGRDTGRTINQIAKHAKAIALGSPGKKYGLQQNPVVLCFFEFESAMQAVIKKLQANDKFSPVSKFFYWGLVNELWNGKELSMRNINKEIIFKV